MDSSSPGWIVSCETVKEWGSVTAVTERANLVRDYFIDGRWLGYPLQPPLPCRGASRRALSSQSDAMESKQSLGVWEWLNRSSASQGAGYRFATEWIRSGCMDHIMA